MNTLIVGDQEIDIGSEAKLNIRVSSIGCILIGNGDLYDLGVRESQIQKAEGRATLKINGVTINIEELPR